MYQSPFDFYLVLAIEVSFFTLLVWKEYDKKAFNLPKSKLGFPVHMIWVAVQNNRPPFATVFQHNCNSDLRFRVILTTGQFSLKFQVPANP